MPEYRLVRKTLEEAYVEAPDADTARTMGQHDEVDEWTVYDNEIVAVEEQEE